MSRMPKGFIVGSRERIRLARGLGRIENLARSIEPARFPEQDQRDAAQGLLDAIHDARWSARGRRSPAWLVSQSDRYRRSYRIGQLSVVLLTAEPEPIDQRSDLAALVLARIDQAGLYLEEVSRISGRGEGTLSLEEVIDSHRQALEADGLGDWSSDQRLAAACWLADNRGALLAPGGLDEQNWGRIHRARREWPAEQLAALSL